MSGDHVRGDVLVAWALEELDASESQRVAGHLDRCERCREEAKVTRSAVEALRREPAVEAPGHVLVSLLEAQSGRARSWRPRRLTGVPAMAAAAALVLLFAAGFWTGRRSIEPARAPVEEPVPARAPLPPPPRIPFASA